MTPGKSGWLPPEQYFASLPAAVAAAGLAIFDADGNALLVRPDYQTSTPWEIVGGVCDAGEYPADTAVRELAEELAEACGLTVGRLLAVDVVPPEPPRPTLIVFVFDGGTITPEGETRIQFADGELAEHRLVPLDEADTMLVPRLARRLRAAADARSSGQTLYLHHGTPYLPETRNTAT
ncbi:MAG: NUDIX hydrolase [Catenulispora sp.]|nr:NUDIX hydrolase [Catenulispora sp.]NUR57223.1 NUDIX hydrolase [Catenulispora sp.]